MEKLMNFFKTKTIGYFIVAGATLLALVVAIVFFCTYNKPELDPIFHANPMGNKAVGLAPETIGIFLIAGAVVELVVLVMPQFRFFHLFAIVLFGLALYKDIIIIADFLAGLGTGVMYNGGNLGLNMFFIVALFIIAIAAVTSSFLGFIKEEPKEEASKEVKEVQENE